MTYSKYGNKVCYLHRETYVKFRDIQGLNPLDFYRFDSELERDVYLALYNWTVAKNLEYDRKDKKLGIKIDRQQKINLIDDEDIKVNHIVDFSITLEAAMPTDSRYSTEYRKINQWYVEAKGLPTAEAILKWKMLENRYRYFQSGNYIVLGTPKRSKQAISGYPIYPITKGLDVLSRSLNTFVDAYEVVNSVLR